MSLFPFPMSLSTIYRIPSVWITASATLVFDYIKLKGYFVEGSPFACSGKIKAPKQKRTNGHNFFQIRTTVPHIRNTLFKGNFFCSVWPTLKERKRNSFVPNAVQGTCPLTICWKKLVSKRKNSWRKWKNFNLEMLLELKKHETWKKFLHDFQLRKLFWTDSTLWTDL